MERNIALGLEYRNVPAEERAARVRQAIARTLANEPAILLMDEPFGALDAETRWHMQELMMSIVEQARTTVLMVTHDIEEAIFVADRIIFMSRHPGTVAANIVPEFKRGRRWDRKEEVMALDGYVELERQIMQLMRAQAGEETLERA